jgi:hypothetical protein
MRTKRTPALASAALAACLLLGAASARADEYEGFAAVSDASNPLALQLIGGSFAATIYEDKGKTCAGENSGFTALRQAVLGAATGWVRVSYKGCKEDFALLCVDTDLASKGALATCTAITTQPPPGPDIIESFGGTVTTATFDDAQDPTISFNGAVFNATVKADSKNSCNGKDNFAAVRKLLKSVKDDQSVRITFKSCMPERAVVCVDTALTGDFKPTVCASVATVSNGD